ncbi:hypothetical protein Tco_0179159 [Tanacetum coccineum]
MMIALNAKKKLKIVTSALSEPSVDSKERAIWERTNDMIISWILNTISDQISNNLNFVNSAFALWSELHEHYAQLDGYRIYQLVNDMIALKQQNCSIEEGHSGDEYYKIKGYLVGHPLHGKYKPPVVKNSGVNDNRNSKVNLVSGQDAASSST